MMFDDLPLSLKKFTFIELKVLAFMVNTCSTERTIELLVAGGETPEDAVVIYNDYMVYFEKNPAAEEVAVAEV